MLRGSRQPEFGETDARNTISERISDGVASTPASSLAPASDSDDSIDKMPGPSKQSRFARLRRKTKAKTKRIFKSKDTSEDEESEDEQESVINGLKHDPAFSSGQRVKGKRFSASGVADKTLGTLQTVGKSIVHPKDAIKSKATKTTAGQLSKAERPFLSQQSDLEYLQAHDNLKRAESTGSSMQGTSDEDYAAIIDGHRSKVNELEAHRESLQAAWTTSRHVRRVRVVPKRHIHFPENEYFLDRDAHGKVMRYDWLKWLGYNLIYYTQDFSAQYIDDFDELPFNIDSCRHYVERLVMASAPWQSWAMHVRSVYRWENPEVTGRWFATYLVLWYTQHIMGFLYGYIIYIVLKNRFHPTSVDSLRESMKRSLESTGTASKFGELVDKHGRKDWLEPFMDDLGPYIQLQLGDMANMLEVFSNFYHWKYPRKTNAALFFFASCLTVSFFADMAFCMKIVWFISGSSFFLCWPIASIYPKYRYLVSPFKWILWDIPTNAEWSFQYLRRQAQITREELIKRKVEEGHSREVADPAVDRYTGRMTTIPKIHIDGGISDDGPRDSSDDETWQSTTSTTSVLEASDIRSFRAHCGSSIGRLIVFSDGVRFVRSIKKAESWRVLFVELTEMRKIEGNQLSKLVSSPNQLEIKSMDGRKVCVEGMKERDEAFNTIIAFSGLQWQSLQIRHNTNAQES